MESHHTASIYTPTHFKELSVLLSSLELSMQPPLHLGADVTEKEGHNCECACVCVCVCIRGVEDEPHLDIKGGTELVHHTLIFTKQYNSNLLTRHSAHLFDKNQSD